MESLLVIVVGGLVVGAAFGALGAWIAAEKGRPPAQGAFIGFFFGPLGALILALLPSLPKPGAKQTTVRRSGRSRSVVTSWEMPDDWEPEPEKPKGEDDEDRALRYLNGPL